jgi:hypothetical protein
MASYFSAVCPDCGRAFAPARLEDHRAEAHADLRPADGLVAGRAESDLLAVTDAEYEGLLRDVLAPPFLRHPRSPRRQPPSREARLGLRERIAQDVALLTAGLDRAPREPGRPRGDLSAYGPALAEAIRTCPHRNVDDAPFEGQWLCDDCGRYLTRANFERR